jgi:hypothetical protein
MRHLLSRRDANLARLTARPAMRGSRDRQRSGASPNAVNGDKDAPSALSRRLSDQVVSVPGERKRVLELAVLRGECDSASRRAALPLETGIVIGGC